MLSCSYSGKWLRRLEEGAEQWFIREKENVTNRRAREVQKCAAASGGVG